ncbi:MULTISPECIES: hypothetical protein [Pectobacterium]|uniref:hypothetical protein n=1 Tax=Pectobacterium TaxID=122277 RepID=UPI000D728705|nr:MULTISPECIES: hypothetical protein [Pectobacterium]PXB00568.1 hypothetical protein DMB41_18830 [Pectobacterium carotovorum subsp. carotovorum]
MSIKEIGNKICDYLILSSHQKEALEIDGLLKKILDENNDPIERKEAADNLSSRCHPRWLGDYYIDGVTYKEWTDLITRLKKSLNKIK